ncbi:TRAP transporter large permease [Acidaminobacter hydrogenoformans]|uniref:TRAP transporter, DctM subunit n=1 Tax=Acidaminobacter hydrogenoformans DSM 2784 TaxID=1120920 RepID=A0A1G5S5E5_9FIRM|nr:TRAP transporter large permease [Acidaminobacter hydrogenoformans]SCZ81553.1 TRAP transporter, DctM subunit [Acidaminobacter hydrogenoformans DSM 2784]
MLTLVLIDVILLVVLLMFSVPLPYCFGGALAFMAVAGGASMRSMMLWGFGQMISPILLASPLFILAGLIMARSGVAQHLLNFADIFVGRVKGGIGVVAVTTCAIIGAISGSGFTGVAATGPVLIPRMVEQGYPRGYATALVTVSSVLGLLIPPSVIMIIYGWVTETSILAAFLSTVGPGLMIVLSFSIINMIWVRKMPDIILEEKLPAAEMRTRNLQRMVRALPGLSLPVIILGGIYGGVFTPSEAAAVAAIVSIPIGFWVYKELKFKTFLETVNESSLSIGAIMTMIMFTLMLSQTYVLLKVPQALVDIIFGITTNKVLLLIVINVFLFFVGMIVNDVTGMILIAPLLLPLVTELGISPVHFASIMGVNLAMGGVTPPYASILYLGMRIGNCQFHEILRPTLVFLLFGYLPIVFLTTFWPPLSMYLPTLMGFVK